MRRSGRLTFLLAISSCALLFGATTGGAADPAQADALKPLQQQFRGQITAVMELGPSASPQADPLELSAMARAALNYLRGNPEPKRNFECKFSLGPLGIPSHVPLLPPNEYAYDPISLADTDCRMDWQYTHMREVAGIAEPDPVELGVRKRILGYLGPDHLVWTHPGAWVGEQPRIEGKWASPWGSAHVLISLSDTYQRTHDPAVAQQAKQIMQALRKLVSWDGPRAYFAGGAVPWKNGQWLQVGWAATHTHGYPFMVEPLTRYYECTGDKDGLELAKAFAEGILAGSQPDQGKQHIDASTGAFEGHVHLHTRTVWGMAHLGALLKEPRYLDWARRAYEFVVAHGTDYGWYPEFIPQEEYRTEICVVGDMTSTAAWLARSGQPHYWDHVDRTVRNELRRSQFFLTPAFLKLFREVNKGKKPLQESPLPLAEGQEVRAKVAGDTAGCPHPNPLLAGEGTSIKTTTNPNEAIEAAIVELRRLEGGFVAQAGFDDWVSYFGTLGKPGMNTNGIHMMGCCPPEGMRAIWEAWRSVVEEDAGVVRVNLAISRDHPAAKVTAFAPASGRISVEPKRAATFELRPPAWVDRGSVRLLRDGQSQEVAWGGPANEYVVCRDARPHEQLVLTWAVPQFVQRFTPASIPGRTPTITVHWRGNEVVGVEPRGQYLPMF